MRPGQPRLMLTAWRGGGRTPTLELRASMIVGAGGTSWQVVRDLALRLPAVVLPAWAASRTCPVAIDRPVPGLRGALTAVEEALVDWLAPRRRGAGGSGPDDPRRSVT